MTTAHERLKKDFEELLNSLRQELMKGLPKGSPQTRLDKIEGDVDALNHRLFVLEAPKPSWWDKCKCLWQRR